jgi:hypothetical protein
MSSLIDDVHPRLLWATPGYDISVSADILCGKFLLVSFACSIVVGCILV